MVVTRLALALLRAAAALSPGASLAQPAKTEAHAREQGAVRGRVAAGFEADFVVLGSDPAHGVRNLADVRYTIRGGRMIDQTPAR